MGRRRSGCERGRAEGLECLFKTGTWAKLRRYNVPAIIELSSPNGDRRYATVVALGEDTATLEFGDRRYVLPFSEVDRYWEGPFIVLWRAASVTASSIAPGARGKDVEWVRQRLSELDGTPVGGRQRDVFDEDLRVPRHRVPARPIAGRGWDRRRGDPDPPERRRARSAHPAPIRDGLLTGRRGVLYPRRPQESRAEAAARAKSADARHDPSPPCRGPSADSSAAAGLWVAGAVIVVNAGRRDVAPAPGRDEVHRIAGQAGLILAARPRGRRPRPARRPRQRPALGRTTRDRRPCALGAGPSPCTRDAGSLPSSRLRSGSGPRACVGIRSGDNQRSRDQSRGSACAAAGRGETRSAQRRIRRTPHRPSRLLPCVGRRPQKSPSRRRAPRPLPRRRSGPPPRRSASRGRDPAGESSEAARARAGITRRPTPAHLRPRLSRPQAVRIWSRN